MTDVARLDARIAGLGETVPQGTGPVVCSYNEWDPLEEVVVGIVEGSAVPEWHVQLESTMPPSAWNFFQRNGGQPFPAEDAAAAKDDLVEFVELLESNGVRVMRPKPVRFDVSYGTPEWKCVGGLYGAMPRDVLLVVGTEIIEAPMAWRSRYFEFLPYRELVKDYFRRGARWTAAPKPQMADELYDYTYDDPDVTGRMAYSLTEFEPAFDAADFVRCGRDLFGQRSNTTNAMGIEWLRRHLDGNYRVHTLDVRDNHPMHIDATIMPLAPGKILVNANRITLPGMFTDWEPLPAPEPCMDQDQKLYMTSRWISMNVLSLDENRVIVEKGEWRMIEALERWGFEPIPCSFKAFGAFGGSFHCATADIRRRGRLDSYF